MKYEIPSGDTKRSAVWYEARVYQQLGGSAIPRIHWSGSDGGADVIVMDRLGPTLEQLRMVQRGTLSLKTVFMIGIQMVRAGSLYLEVGLTSLQLDFIEYSHSRGVVLRDVKPQNTAVGDDPVFASRIYNFDFGNARMYIDPTKGAHIPLRTGCRTSGTIRFCSHWSHQGLGMEFPATDI